MPSSIFEMCSSFRQTNSQMSVEAKLLVPFSTIQVVSFALINKSITPKFTISSSNEAARILISLAPHNSPSKVVAKAARTDRARLQLCIYYQNTRVYHLANAESIVLLLYPLSIGQTVLHIQAKVYRRLQSASDILTDTNQHSRHLAKWMLNGKTRAAHTHTPTNIIEMKAVIIALNTQLYEW